MLTFTAFEPAHLRLVVAQHQQIDEAVLIEMGVGDKLVRHFGLTGWEDGRPLLCAGLVDIHPHRAFLWGYLSRECRPHMVQLTRYVRFVLQGYPAKRIEATIHPEFRAARRWLEMLAFEYEASLEAYDELGREMLMFKRIRR